MGRGVPFTSRKETAAFLEEEHLDLQMLQKKILPNMIDRITLATQTERDPPDVIFIGEIPDDLAGKLREYKKQTPIAIKYRKHDNTQESEQNYSILEVTETHHGRVRDGGFYMDKILDTNQMA